MKLIPTCGNQESHMPKSRIPYVGFRGQAIGLSQVANGSENDVPIIYRLRIHRRKIQSSFRRLFKSFWIEHVV